MFCALKKVVLFCYFRELFVLCRVSFEFNSSVEGRTAILPPIPLPQKNTPPSHIALCTRCNAFVSVVSSVGFFGNNYIAIKTSVTFLLFFNLIKIFKNDSTKDNYFIGYLLEI